MRIKCLLQLLFILCSTPFLSGSNSSFSNKNAPTTSVESRIISCSSTENLAFNKSATQNGTQQEGIPGLAVDGNHTGSAWVSPRTVTTTNWGVNSWWEVDLGAKYNIETIKAWNQTDLPVDFSNFYILVSDVPFSSTSLATAKSQSGVTDFYVHGEAGRPSNHSINRTGRYVRIQRNASGLLRISEIEVIGCSIGTSCPPAGTSCNDNNPNTQNDIEDGNCNCQGVVSCSAALWARTECRDGYNDEYFAEVYVSGNSNDSYNITNNVNSQQKTVLANRWIEVGPFYNNQNVRVTARNTQNYNCYNLTDINPRDCTPICTNPTLLVTNICSSDINNYYLEVVVTSGASGNYLISTDYNSIEKTTQLNTPTVIGPFSNNAQVDVTATYANNSTCSSTSLNHKLVYGQAFIDSNDNDGDRICNAADCEIWNPTIPRSIGSPCDDGDSETSNDMIIGDPCTCRGCFLEVTTETICDGTNSGTFYIDVTLSNATVGSYQLLSSISSGIIIGAGETKRLGPYNSNISTFFIISNKEGLSCSYFQDNITKECPSCNPTGTSCNDNNPQTYNDIEDGACNCVGTPCPTSGTVCNDNNAQTYNDRADGFCNCIGTPCPTASTVCNDNNAQTYNDRADGFCNCVGTPCPTAGTVCNDNNPQTYNDMEDGFCNCVGTPCLTAGTVCNDNNPQTYNDMEDGSCNCVGTSCPSIGTACNDNNPYTSNDIEDGSCNCAGTEQCTYPSGENIVFNGDGTATITWNPVPNATSYYLQYRLKGATYWLSIGGASTSRTFTGITPNLQYEYRLRARCSGVWKNSPKKYFTVPSDNYDLECAHPDVVVTTNSDGTVSVTWEAISNATSYVFIYRKKGTSSWTNITNATSSRFLTNLEIGSVYEYLFDTKCNGLRLGYDYPVKAFTPILECSYPSDEVISFNGNGTASITWSPVFEATNYIFRYRLVGTTKWSTFSGTPTTKYFTGINGVVA